VIPSKGEIQEAMDTLSRHPTPTDFVAIALNMAMPAYSGIVKRCDFVLHLTDGRTIEVKGNDIK